MAGERQQHDRTDHQILEKSEVLLLDKNEDLRNRLKVLLDPLSIIVTATSDEERALKLAQEKHFAVILLDMDTPSSGAGLDLASQLQVTSPASHVVLWTSRKTFDLAVQGFRQGTADVIAKAPDEEQHLIDKVKSLCLETRRTDERVQVLREALGVHEKFLQRFMDTFRKAKEAENLASGSVASWNLLECIILVVDDNPQTAQGLRTALGTEARYRCVSALNGGEALDFAGNSIFHIALVKDSLPDLSGSMVAKSLREQCDEGIVLLFEHPSSKPGYVSIVERHQTIKLIRQLKTAGQLVDRIHEMREAYVGKSLEKHIFECFREEHLDFLKQYAELRQKITRLLPSGER